MASPNVERLAASLGRAGRARRPRLATVDHKRIGMRYLVTARVFFLLGGARGADDARAARAARTSTLLSPEAYDQLFSMHGVTMIFLFVTPMLSGFGNYLVPLHDRRARHGVPAAERVRLLGLPRRRPLHLLGPRARQGARRRLVQLRAALDARYARAEHRLLRARPDLPRHLDHGRRDQLHRHDRQAARARDVDQPDAALLLGGARDVARRSSSRSPR